MQQRVIIIAGLTCLTACGGGGGGGGSSSGIDPRLARLDIYEAQKLRVLGDPGAGVPGLPVTADENVPGGGAINFAGSGTIRVEARAAPIVIFGDATLRVDFVNGNATGAIDNTFGTNSSDAVIDYSGSLSLQSGVASQDMPVDYAGTLTGGGQTLGFDGTLTALLLGNPTIALSGADLEAEIDQNGVMRSGTLVITMEEDVDAP